MCGSVGKRSVPSAEVWISLSKIIKWFFWVDDAADVVSRKQNRYIDFFYVGMYITKLKCKTVLPSVVGGYVFEESIYLIEEVDFNTARLW